MFIGILVLITALSISAVAIYYSVAGLVAIFAAAALPIMIMGGVLEVGKLVTAVWLHRYWKQATWWLKSYLSLAVVVLMLITSMGIFGFLSKAHIEQTSQSTDNLAQVETLQSEIDRQLAVIGRAENKIRELDNSQSNTDSTIQEQIDREQTRIDTAYDRVQPLVNEQNENLQDQIALFGLDKIDAKIAALDEAMSIDTKDRESVRFLQSMVGAKPDGAYGSGTAARVDEYRNGLNSERQLILDKIQAARNATTQEIARIRQRAEEQIAQSNKLINRLREQLGKQDNDAEIQTAIDEQNERVRTASNEVDRLTEEKIQLESEYRKLEAEVGPIKYIAEFIYGDTADNNMLEEAVRWVIITIIFVFDPLAVLLLIASQYTFEYRRKDDDGGRLRQEYEQLRAEKIANNPGYTVDPQTTEKEVDEVTTEKEGSGDTTETSVRAGLTPGTYSGDTQPVPVEQGEDLQEDEERIDSDRPTTTSVGAGYDGGDTAEGMALAVERLEKILSKEEIVDSYTTPQPKKKESLDASNSEKSLDEQQRASRYEELDSDKSYTDAKAKWKAENPNETLKQYKLWYIKGLIDKLPWEDYVEQKSYIKKDTDGNQTKGYQQNSEQNENSLWKRIRDNESD